MRSSRARTSWRISEVQTEPIDADIVAGEFPSGPIGKAAMLGRDRLGEDRLAGAEREAFEIVADGEAARLAGLGRKAEIPFLVVPHPGGHVDHHRAGEPGRGRAGEDVPEDRRAQRPADPDRALKIERVGELGDVRGHPLDRRAGAVCGRSAMAAQVDGDDPEISRQPLLRAKEAAMRHQPVQQHDRRAVAAVAIGDSRPVRSDEFVQDPSKANRDPVRDSAAFGGLMG